MPPCFEDDKTPICVPFVLDALQDHQSRNPHGPLIVGLNGVQGVGKTVLVRNLAKALQGHGVNTVVCSVDDFYLTHADQVEFARSHADNMLVQHRGEPGTHDVSLMTEFVSTVLRAEPARIPQYDKAAFNGQGDRLPESEWVPVNQPGQPAVQVLLFEGWCMGFRKLPSHQVEAKWKNPSRTLRHHKLEHLLFVNDQLEAYSNVLDRLHAFVHVDSENLEYVYAWRLEQEEHLREERGDPGVGMTPKQVAAFVDGYYPAYELYTEALRESGPFVGGPGRRLRLVVGQNRKVKETIRT